MMDRGDLVLVACSGGPDSMALLGVLAEVGPSIGVRLAVVTIDHGLRDAGAEQDLVHARATELGLPFRLERVDVEREDGSLMQGARTARSAALERVARELGARRIATGHTASDQAETVLMRLLRGAGTRGLAGIPPVRGPYVRPLLGCTRSQVLDYLRAHALPWAQDPTNDDVTFARNRLRHEVLPMLAELSPSVEQVLADTADRLREDRLALDSVAEEALRGATVESSPGSLGLDLAKLAEAPRGLLPHVLRRATERVRRAEGGLYAAHLQALVELARGRAGTRELHLPGARVAREYGTLRLKASKAAAEPTRPMDDGKEIFGPGCYRFGRMLLTVERTMRSDQRPLEGPWGATFDALTIRFPLVLRPWEPGDRFVPYGMKGHKKVSDLLVDEQLPRRERGGVCVLAQGDEILWVLGVRRGAGHPVDEGTTELLHVRAHLTGTPNFVGGRVAL